MKRVSFAAIVAAMAWVVLAGEASARASINVSSMDVDGQAVRDLACEIDNGGMFAVMSVVGTVAKQKKALDACAPAGAAFRVAWTWAGGKATRVDVLAASDKTKSACIQKALQLTTTDTNGDCRAVLLVGDAAAAKRAATKLPAAK